MTEPTGVALLVRLPGVSGDELARALGACGAPVYHRAHPSWRSAVAVVMPERGNVEEVARSIERCLDSLPDTE